ncbi:hypothetical protein [Natronorubrum sp. FCH18a]|uniref:hypothetical protein n=1 Tax=Natronorubrum sp. FCH18a TaxID=3447018 RepID=UPI003F5167BC
MERLSIVDVVVKAPGGPRRMVEILLSERLFERVPVGELVDRDDSRTASRPGAADVSVPVAANQQVESLFAVGDASPRRRIWAVVGCRWLVAEQRRPPSKDFPWCVAKFASHLEGESPRVAVLAVRGRTTRPLEVDVVLAVENRVIQLGHQGVAVLEHVFPLLADDRKRLAERVL